MFFSLSRISSFIAKHEFNCNNDINNIFLQHIQRVSNGLPKIEIMDITGNFNDFEQCTLNIAWRDNNKNSLQKRNCHHR